MEPETRKIGKLCLPLIQEIDLLQFETKLFKCENILSGKYISFTRTTTPLEYCFLHFNQLYIYGNLVKSTIQHGYSC